jgi:cytochrome c2
MFETWCACVVLLGAVLMVPHEKRSSRAGASPKGKELFGQCRGCHSAETGERKAGPSLQGLFKRTRMRTGQAVSEKTVREKIEQGGDGMPAYSGLLSEQEKNDLIAFLKEL